MQFRKKAFTLGFSLLTSLSLLAQTHEVTIETKDIHVPEGFDSNDNVEVIITGNLPNTCYRRPQAHTKLEEGRINIDVKAIKLEGPEVNCIMALVPYMISVPLGQLSEGNYAIMINPGSNGEKGTKIKVDRSNSNSIDDHTYANVTGVKRIANSNYIILTGYHPSSCMSIENVQVIGNEAGDTVSVLPIIRQTQPICDRQVVQFEQKVEIPQLAKKDVLIHVRKIDGTAANYLMERN